jgi:hypothetical protein
LFKNWFLRPCRLKLRGNALKRLKKGLPQPLL